MQVYKARVQGPLDTNEPIDTTLSAFLHFFREVYKIHSPNPLSNPLSMEIGVHLASTLPPLSEEKHPPQPVSNVLRGSYPMPVGID
jgi:hypothetical protein